MSKLLKKYSLKNTYIFCLDSNALKCYECSSEEENCKHNSVTCKLGRDRCMKASLAEGGKHAVVKGCRTTDVCSKGGLICSVLKKEYGLTECDVNCCSTDNCNHSSKNSQTMFGVIVFGVLAAITLK